MIKCRQNVQFLVEFSLLIVAYLAGEQMLKSLSLAADEFQTLFLDSFHEKYVHFAADLILVHSEKQKSQILSTQTPNLTITLSSSSLLNASSAVCSML